MSDNKISPYGGLGTPRVQPKQRIEPRTKEPQPKPREQPKDSFEIGKGKDGQSR